MKWRLEFSEPQDTPSHRPLTYPANDASNGNFSVGELDIAPAESKRGSLAGLVSALVLLVFVATLSYLGWQQYSNAAAETRRTIQQIFALSSVMRPLEEAHNAYSAYLLSGEPVYAEQSRSSIQQIKTALPNLRSVDQLTSSRVPALQTSVSELVADLENALPRNNGGTPSRAEQTARIDRDMNRLVGTRLLGDQIQQSLETRLNAQRANTRQYARWAQLSASIGCMGVFAILLASNINIRRLLSMRDHLNSRLLNANQDLQQFIFSASHDLQEPLRTLRIFSDSLENKLKAKRPIERELFHLRTAAEQMSNLITDLLTYTEITTESVLIRGLTNSDKVLSKVMVSLNQTITDSDARVDVESLCPLPMAPSHAEHVFRNLLNNAIRYRSPERPPVVRIRCSYGRKHWTVSISDNGIGIPPEYHQHIFGIFKRLHTRTEYPGTGLGLAICKKIVERYGGKIWVESAVGRGSTFFFTLPENRRLDQKA